MIDADDRIRFCITQTMFAGQHTPEELVELGEGTLKLADYASRHLDGRTRSAKPLGQAAASDTP